jgi:CheY-like chemotaxis protein/predicted nucleotide-binding protein
VRVLWIDDDRELVKASLPVFQRHGFDVISASTLSRALTILRRESRALDGVLLDVRLGAGENGIEFLAEIKDKYPHLRVVIFTAYPDYGDHVDAVEAGATLYLQKVRKAIPAGTRKQAVFFESLRRALGGGGSVEAKDEEVETGPQRRVETDFRPAARRSERELGPVSEVDPRRVFLVHGRCREARIAMTSFLRALDLRPIEWNEAAAMTGESSPFIGQVIEAGFAAAQAVVVLLTGDDLAHLRPELLREDDQEYERKPTPQARPNVLFEAGFALAKHPKRTLLVEIGRLRPFCDVQGRYVIRMDGTGPTRQALADRLRIAGCKVSLEGTDWHSAGDFGPPAGLARARRAPRSRW